MPKSLVWTLTLCLTLAACSPAADPAASAQPATAQLATAQQAAPTRALALTAEVGTAVLGTAPASATAIVAATLGGPIVITAEPANGTPQPGGTALAVPVASPIPTLAGGLSPTELKYDLLAAFPDLFYCDPDVYPVAVADEAALAEKRFPSLQADTQEFQAILSHTNLAGLTAFSADQKLLIYRAHKKLAAVRFTLSGGQYQFQLQTRDAAGKGLLITGLIDGRGAISAQQSQPALVTCPV